MRWKKVIHANGNKKKSGIAIFRPNRLWKQKTVYREIKKGHCITINRSNPVRRYNNCKYIHKHRNTYICEQKLANMKREIVNNTIILGTFNSCTSGHLPEKKQHKTKNTSSKDICTPIFIVASFYQPTYESNPLYINS